MRRLVVGVTLVMLACSQGGDAWEMKDAPKVPPDYQYRTGVEAGVDYWEWNCYEGHRVRISRSGNACYQGPPRQQKIACGERFAGDEHAGHAHRLPDSLLWPGADAGLPPWSDDNAKTATETDASSPAPSAGPSATSPAP